MAAATLKDMADLLKKHAKRVKLSDVARFPPVTQADYDDFWIEPQPAGCRCPDNVESFVLNGCTCGGK